MLTISVILFCGQTSGAPFRNLDFEATINIESGVPHWEVDEEVYLYNAIFAGEGSVTLYDRNFPEHFQAFLPQEVHDPLQGDQSIMMIWDPVGPPHGGSISQLGDVPANASLIELAVFNLQGIRLSLNGDTIPLLSIAHLGSFDIVWGDVSQFAGSTVRMTISPLGGDEYSIAAVDAIRFVVPEPTMHLMFTGGVMVMVNMYFRIVMRTRFRNEGIVQASSK